MLLNTSQSSFYCLKLSDIYSLKATETLNKINDLRQAVFEEEKHDYFLVFNRNNLVYFTNFPSATALLIPKEGESTLYVSAVNYEQAKAETKGLIVERLKRGESLMEKISKHKLSKKKKFAFDSLPMEAWRSLEAFVGEQKLDANASNGVIRDLRKIKDPEEIGLIREACNLTNIGMQVASETIKAGVKGKEIVAEIEYAMRQKGSDGTDFDTMIASGVYSAFPRGSSPDRTIQEGDLVVVDLGATYKFYHSDMTRTFVAGKPTEKQTQIYETVKSAHQKAFETIKPKIKAKDVDAAARQIIEEAGYGAFFLHNVGHGVGLEAHEMPILSLENREPLVAGNVVTDEPGIFMPTFGGVRIEDTILVTEKGAEKLTNGPYTLQG
jgi:Xaa-Pro dipeptidase